jgi:hypothetical protein
VHSRRAIDRALAVSKRPPAVALWRCGAALERDALIDRIAKEQRALGG